jgi:hypothetical protein
MMKRIINRNLFIYRMRSKELNFSEIPYESQKISEEEALRLLLAEYSDPEEPERKRPIVGQWGRRRPLYSQGHQIR